MIDPVEMNISETQNRLQSDKTPVTLESQEFFSADSGSADSEKFLKSENINAEFASKSTSDMEYESTSSYKFALIDASHYGKFSNFGPEDDSLWGLSINLMRNMYIPIFIKDFSDEELSKSNLMFVVAPTKIFSAEETNRLGRFLRQGGRLIWSVGWEDIEASANGLKKLGFDIDAVPLGSGRVETDFGPVEFVEAWPVIYGNASQDFLWDQAMTAQYRNLEKMSSPTIMAEKFNYPVMVSKKVGKGGVTVIGDSQFFLSKNIESYEKHKPENIAFLKHMIQRGWDK